MKWKEIKDLVMMFGQGFLIGYILLLTYDYVSKLI